MCNTERAKEDTSQSFAWKTHLLCCIPHGLWLPAAGTDSRYLFSTSGNKDPKGSHMGIRLPSAEKVGGRRGRGVEGAV